MPKITNIKCITTGCPCWISGPCEKTKVLFGMRTDLMERLEKTPADKQVTASLNHLDALMESELGFQDAQLEYHGYKKATTVGNATLHFTLVCAFQHKNHYNIKC